MTTIQPCCCVEHHPPVGGPEIHHRGIYTNTKIDDLAFKAIVILNFRLPLKKRYATHSFLLGLLTIAALQGRAATGANQNSLLYQLASGEEVVEGPLDPSSYTRNETITTPRLAAIGGDSIDFITIDDPEFAAAAVLGGSSVVGLTNPEGRQPVEIEHPTPASSPVHQTIVYTVEEGDTIGTIAEKFNLKTTTLLAANGLPERELIHAGDQLTILPADGVLHTVKSGETVSSVSAHYDISAADIIVYNHLNNDAAITIGQKLIIPGATAAPVATALAHRATDQEASPPVSPVKLPSLPALGKGFLWPTTTKHISQYFRWGHTGVDIDNRSRPAVYAAEAGQVKTTRRLGGYGNLIVVSHGKGLETYYAHLDRFYVSPGDQVTKGQAIGQMGSTGRSTGPHLHFEVRIAGRPANPLGYF